MARIGRLAAVTLAAVGLLVAGCTSDDGDQATTTTAVAGTAATSPSTTAAPTTTAVPTTTAAPTTTATPTTTAAPVIPATVPGSACVEGSSRDCIDPFGDGQFVYLIGGGDCIVAMPDPAICADLDGDGYAGYPDAG